MATEHVFNTSGSTCAPRQWVRTRRQMEQEAGLVYGLWASGVRDILSFAPAMHSYGMILGPVAAEVTGARLQQCSLELQRLPDLSDLGPCVILCIASTWKLLPSLLQRLHGRQPVLVLHSASIVPSGAAAVVSRFAAPDVRLIEILGATETGAIAHRPIAALDETPLPWTPFDDVTLLNKVGTESRLELHSPRIARELAHRVPSLTHQSDDLVQVLANGQFQWLGRASSLIKINGVRQDLAVIRAELSHRAQCPNLVCVPVFDDLRAEAYEVLFSSTSLDEQGVRRALDALGAGYPRPLRITRVAHVPLSVSGKPQAWAIQDGYKESAL